MAQPWPLVGRDEELEFATSALDGPGIVVTGGAGVGKTRLTGELLSRAQRDGIPTVRVLCTAATADIPLGALAPLLPPATTSSDPLGASPRLQLLSALRQSVRERAEDGRIVLGVDDAQLLDEVGAAALLQLVVAGEATIVATARTSEGVPDPIRSLWRDAGCARLELQNLAQDDVHALIEQVVGGPLAPSSSARICTLTRGNPLFVREVVSEAVETGTLTANRGIWTWSGTVAATAPLRELVSDRLGRLDDDERATVALVAAGEPLPLDVLSRATSDEMLNRLEANGLLSLTRTGDGTLTVRLGHPLYGEVLRSSDPQTAAAQRRLVALVGDNPPPNLCLSTALWALSAGATLPPPVFMTAYEQARARDDDDLASRLAQAAVDAGGGVAASAALGRALTDADRPEAELVLLPLLDAEDEAVRATAVTSLSDLYRYALRRPQAALDVLDDATDFDEPWRSYVEAHRATILAFSGQMPDAEAISVPLLDNPDPRVRVRAIVPAGMALALGGRGETALHCIDARLPDAMNLEEELPIAMGWWAGARLLAQLVLGDNQGLADMMETVKARAADTGYFGAHFALIQGRAFLAQGRPVAATTALRDAVSRPQPGGEEARRWAAALLGEALALTGDFEGATEAWAEADVTNANEAAFLPDMLRAGAWVFASQDLTSDAHKQINQAIEMSASLGLATTEMATLHDAARLGSPAVPIANRAAELSEWMEGQLPPAMYAHISALASGDPEDFSAAARQLEDVGMVLCAAECAMAAGERVWARELSARCEGARTPGLTQGLPDPLTRREREVAALAAQRLSSREIADRLIISVRTVDNHLSRVYVKLGVTSRDELSNALAQFE